MITIPYRIGTPSPHRPDPGRCIIWTGATTKKGYGTVHPTRYTATTAHRWRWSRHHKLTEKQQVDHLCKIRNCIRIKHLEAVSPTTNLERSSNTRFARKYSTHCDRGHEYTPENTKIRGNRTRRCKLCAHIAYLQRRYA